MRRLRFLRIFSAVDRIEGLFCFAVSPCAEHDRLYCRIKAGCIQCFHQTRITGACYGRIHRQLCQHGEGELRRRFLHMALAEDRQKLYERMCENMKRDRARHNILPLSKFGLMQITRQRVRPVTEVTVDETCPTCMGKGTIKSSFLFTDVLEEKIDQLVNHLKIKTFTLHVHPYVYAYINQGLLSLKRRWQMKYGFGVRIIPDQRLAFLQYEFISPDGEEIDMKSEDDMK